MAVQLLPSPSSSAPAMKSTPTVGSAVTKPARTTVWQAEALHHIIHSFISLEDSANTFAVCKEWQKRQFRILINNPKLTVLNLEGFASLTDDDMKNVAIKCHKLQSVNLNYCIHLSQKTIIILTGACPHLKSISARYCRYIPRQTNGVIILKESSSSTRALGSIPRRLSQRTLAGPN